MMDDEIAELLGKGAIEISDGQIGFYNSVSRARMHHKVVGNFGSEADV